MHNQAPDRAGGSHRGLDSAPSTPRRKRGRTEEEDDEGGADPWLEDSPPPDESRHTTKRRRFAYPTRAEEEEAAWRLWEAERQLQAGEWIAHSADGRC